MATTLERPAETVDEAKLTGLVMQALGDFGATLGTAMISIGDRLGLYKALATAPATPRELASRTGTTERYVREWLSANAAGGYVQYDPVSGDFSMSPEQKIALTDESSPYYVVGGFEAFSAATRAEPDIAERFRTGGGFSWGDHERRLFEGIERFFKPGYTANLVASWIPALDGDVDAKLRAGAKVADLGCGHGASTIALASAYPNSTFVGFDGHAPSIERATQLAKDAGVGANATFHVATAQAFPGRDYDLIAVFDALHDMGDPLGAAKQVRQALAPDGTWLIVEPYANDRLEDNLTPIGRIFYGASTLICTPHAISEGGAALGAQAGEARLGEIVRAAGFTRFRRATETPFNLILEARP